MPTPCPTCEFENRDDAAFCGSCGSSLAAERACEACERVNPSAAHFCDGCGAPLAAEPAPPDPVERERVPRSYTPRHLADKILNSKSALEGERKHVTVLFADVKGSMELADQLDPEEWHRILERFFEILSEGVHRFEGTVNQYTGDGIMALFGAPIAHEDHAQRACYAALQLRDEIARYATDVKREYGIGFSTRMGLHSGEVVVGKIGDDLRMDYTAQGQSVGLAQRMESLASPDTCYLTDTTAALVSGYFALEDLGEFRVRGVSEPLRVHQLLGLGTAATRFDISRARGLTRFVGRASDLAALDAALEQARSGNGQVVGVVAEAGTGKSRLCFEFVEKCRASGMTVHEGRAVAHGKNVPYLPMLQVFRAYYGIGDQDDDRTVREKIAGRMLLLDESFREVLPIVFEFFGAPDPERPIPFIDPEEKQRQLFSVLRRLVQGDPNADAGHFSVLLEDLHWLDPGSEAFLEQWVDAVAGSPSLLIANFRPEYHADWMSKSYYRQLPLAPLGPEAIRELLVDLLGSDPSTTGLAETIHERTGGNPFFTEEVVQTLIESGHLEGTRGSYRLVTPIESLEVPASVQGVLAARIDRLGEREKHVVQTAAVIGKEFSEPILCAAAELPDRELRESLSVLKAGEFVYEQSLYPVAEYAFKHPLTQEVALGSQLHERRRRTHAAVARAIEEHSADKLDEAAALLAHHWEGAGEALTAAQWLQRAATWVGRSNALQAVAHMRRVLELTDALPASAERDRLRLDACRMMLQGGWRMGLSEEESEARFVEGRELAERLGDVDQAIGVRTGYGATLGFFSGNVRRYLELTREAVGLIDDSTSAGAAAAALSPGLGYALLVAGRLEESLRSRHAGWRRAEGDPHAGVETLGFSVWGESLQGQAEALAMLGRLDESRTLIERAVQVCRTHDLQEPLAWALGISTAVSYWSGDPAGTPEAEQARRHAVEATEVAERVGSPFSRSHAYRTLAVAHVMHGDHGAAIELLERALRIARESSGREREPEVLASLSRALAGAGELDRAIEVAHEAIELARRFGTRVYEAMGQLALARAELARGGTGADARAAAALDQLEALADETGARILVPDLVEQRAHLAAFLGDADGLASGLRDAQAGFAEIGARGHAGRLAEEIENLQTAKERP